ncbi:hypothetical protein [Holospora curviuscula]|uniref:Uncharacterized protein n=1 Tax=Holospora curviuscula TaxID=1082868 RepID=A0A2S5R992_9PROT|nr:hypothetical protein [Holospora curviuscula]PPE03772.1 hypothetical protein HCUR_00787 [Holospora curviuscula]
MIDSLVSFRHAVQNIVQYFRTRSENKYEEEMRREDMMEAAKRLIPVVSLGMIGLLCVVGGYSYWEYQKDRKLFRAELLYDEYLKDIGQERFESAKKKEAQLKNTKEMRKLLEIERCGLTVSAFTRTQDSKEKEKLWSLVYDAYNILDSHLFAKSRAQSSMYHLTRFILAILANDVSLKDSRVSLIKNYTQGSGSFLGLGYAMKALQQLAQGTLDQKFIEQWERYSQSWIPNACAIGAGISRPMIYSNR